MTVQEWIDSIFENFEVKNDRECIIYNRGTSKEKAAIEFAVRALANPNCEGSQEVLDAINERRQK